jgi:uncharacterized protein (DUF1778 family)
MRRIIREVYFASEIMSCANGLPFGPIQSATALPRPLEKAANCNCYSDGRTLIAVNYTGETVKLQTSSEKRRARASRLGFRVDAETKKLVERAAALEHRSVTDFCLTALTQATQATITQHETIMLSDRDREVFFDALIHPPKPNERLKRAFRSARERIVS